MGVAGAVLGAAAPLWCDVHLPERAAGVGMLACSRTGLVRIRDWGVGRFRLGIAGKTECDTRRYENEAKRTKISEHSVTSIAAANANRRSVVDLICNA